MSFINKAAKNAILCASLFAATAFSAIGQNQTQPAPEKLPIRNNFLQNTEFMVLFGAHHTDRLTPYNERKVFGGFIKQDLNGNDRRFQTSVMQGAYYNSNYTITSTIGSLNEVSVGRFKMGVLAGIAIYPRVEKDITTYNTIYSMDVPETQKKRGHKKYYIPTGKPYEYTEVNKTYKARGLKNKFKVIPALLATFSYNAYKGSGPFAIATYAPWKSGDSHGMGIFAYGLRIDPSPQPR